MKPSDRILDVGSGIGQKARAMASFLSHDGSYEGLEIVAEGVAWCTEHYKPYPRFRFSHADIFSTHYNPSGETKAYEYRFPYPDNDFDLVLLSSVFTHMLPRDVRHYFDEITRVLRTGGKSVITYFLLNDDSREHLRRNRTRPGGWDRKTNSINTPHQYESDLCLVADPSCPETIVSHDETRLGDWYHRHGFEIVDVTYGNWCGREHPAIQDVIVATKTK